MMLYHIGMPRSCLEASQFAISSPEHSGIFVGLAVRLQTYSASTPLPLRRQVQQAPFERIDVLELVCKDSHSQRCRHGAKPF